MRLPAKSQVKEEAVDPEPMPDPTTAPEQAAGTGAAADADGADAGAKAGESAEGGEGAGGGDSTVVALVGAPPVETQASASVSGEVPLQAVGAQAAALHTAKLRQVLIGMPLLPIENAQDILSSSELMLRAEKIKQTTSAEVVESARLDIESWLVLVVQLGNSLRTATADLARENKRHQDKQEREAKMQLERQAMEDKHMKDKAEAQAKKRLEQERATSCFAVPWADVGGKARPLPIVSGDTEIEKALASDSHDLPKFDVPFILRGSEMLTTAVATDPLHKTLASWAAKFPERAAKTQTGQITAPLRAAHGSNCLAPVMEKWLPKSRLASEKLPSLQEKTAEPWLFGSEGTSFSANFEPERLGCVRIFVSGHVRVLAARAAELFEALPAEVRNTFVAGRPIENVSVCDSLLRLVTEVKSLESATALAQTATVWHGEIKVDAGPVVLILPAGMFAATMPINQTVAWGVRKPFLANGGPHSRASIRLLCQLFPDEHLQAAAEVLRVAS